MSEKTKAEIEAIVEQATGTDSHHETYSLPSYPVLTDGVLNVARTTECFWLIDLIYSHQINQRLDKSFQVWKLQVSPKDHSAVVRRYNDQTLIVTQKIPYTDFPLDEIKLYLIDGVILLPSEY